MVVNTTGITNIITNLALEAFAESWSSTMNKLYLELDYVINESFKNYYYYRTSRYYRHGTGRGTGKGENLYRGIHLRKQSFVDNGKNVIIGFNYDLNGEGMEPYTHIRKDGSEAYRPDATDVIRSVASGIRGLFSGSTIGSEYDPEDDESYENVEEGKAGASQTWGNDVSFDSELFLGEYHGATNDSILEFYNYAKEDISKMVLTEYKKRLLKKIRTVR